MRHFNYCRTRAARQINKDVRRLNHEPWYDTYESSIDNGCKRWTRRAERTFCQHSRVDDPSFDHGVYAAQRLDIASSGYHLRGGVERFQRRSLQRGGIFDVAMAAVARNRTTDILGRRRAA
jgi:hypothetical protein